MVSRVKETTTRCSSEHLCTQKIDTKKSNLNNYNYGRILEKKMRDDLKYEGFTKKEFWIYGVLLPLGLIAIMALAGAIESA